MYIFRSKAFFKRLVSDAYDNPDGPAHILIKKKARQWIGFEEGELFTGDRRRFIHRVLKASRTLATEPRNVNLGFQPIGFDDIRIDCLTTDTNSASVYLFGFNDNLTFFDIYRDHIRPGSSAVDVGANLGIHSLVMSRLVGPGGCVHAFEPSTRIFRRMLHNIEKNSSTNISTHNIALSNHSGDMGFVDLSNEINIGKSHVNHNADFKVPVATLDARLSNVRDVSLIKIDVEGHELEVLMGGQKVLSSCRPAVFMEYNSSEYGIDELVSMFPYDIVMVEVPLTYRSDPRQVSSTDLMDRVGQINLLLLPV